MSLKQQIANWFYAPENAKYKNGELSKTDLEKGHKKCGKDLKLNADALRLDYFRYIWREVLKGNIREKTPEAGVEPEMTINDIVIEHWQPGREKLDKNLFVPYKTGDGIDIILSDDGGSMKGTSYIVVGGPGIGKTTVTAAMQRKLQLNYPKAKIACVNTEMKKIDIEYENSRKDWMKDLNYVILKDYGYNNLKNVLRKIFSDGYDIIFLDSIGDIVAKLKAFCDMSENEAEGFILDLMDKANDAKDNHGIHTAVFAIQQVTKSGDYKGSTKLEHMTTGMIVFGKDERGNRHVSTRKNRRCGGHVEKRLYFNLDEKNEVVYDTVTFAQAEEQTKLVKNEQAKLKQQGENFFDTFTRSSAQQAEEVDVEDETIEA